MGVAGCGKSTVGQQLAQRLGGQYLEGDSYHPKTNIAKMEAGIPLTDEDREPWLETIGREISKHDGLVFAGCSALKRSYRDIIRKCANAPVVFIFLNGSKELIAERMAKRTGHFMPTSLLDSQFETLEVPGEDEPHIIVDIAGSPDDNLAHIVNEIETLRLSDEH